MERKTRAKPHKRPYPIVLRSWDFRVWHGICCTDAGAKTVARRLSLSVDQVKYVTSGLRIHYDVETTVQAVAALHSDPRARMICRCKVPPNYRPRPNALQQESIVMMAAYGSPTLAGGTHNINRDTVKSRFGSVRDLMGVRSSCVIIHRAFLLGILRLPNGDMFRPDALIGG